MQEACLKAHAGIAGFAGGNPRAWLLSIVRNASYTWLARNRPRAVVGVGDLADLDDVSPPPDNDAASPEAALIAKADSAAIGASDPPGASLAAVVPDSPAAACTALSATLPPSNQAKAKRTNIRMMSA